LPQNILEEINRNWFEAYEWVADAVPKGEVERSGDCLIVKSALADPDFNVVFGFSRPRSLDKVEDSVRRLFLDENLPWELVTVPETSEFYAPLVKDLGLIHFRTTPGMILDPLPNSVPPQPRSLQIKEVVEFEEIRTFYRTGSLGFGAPPDSLDVLIEATAERAHRQHSEGGLYLGFVDGQPAATSLRFTTRKIGGIYFVSTLPQFRRRGFGEAMTWRAAVDGSREGCTASYLQASEMGRPVYEKMGYRTIVEYQVWMPPTSTTSA
jgi:ribosomal protein S18 acetylase RimI-like enzyme